MRTRRAEETMLNGNLKSRIEIHLGVVRNLLDDLATMIEGRESLRVRYTRNIAREIERDYAYIASRTHSEGLSFLTTVLPSLGKWYDVWLSGQDPGAPPSAVKPFEMGAHCTPFACPVLLRLLGDVISDESGSVKDRAQVIKLCRSIFYCFYKLEVPFTPQQLEIALAKWKANEIELHTHVLPDFYDIDLCRVREVIHDLFRDAESVFTDIVPRHGPGAVAGGEHGDEKWETPNIIRTLHRTYPWYDLYLVRGRDGHISSDLLAECISLCKRVKRIEKPLSRLCFVPKDSRGPRIICCEPKELMFIQQGVQRNLTVLLERRSEGRINFIDQSINANLALTSSETGMHATVDMKDASDRVSTELVMLVFPLWAHRYLHALRSHGTILPDGQIFVDHAKFAPMGSAICFPIESAIFWSVCVAAAVSCGYSYLDAKRASYVYGDDIVIHPEVFPALQRICAKVGLLLNLDKTYVSGPFRESCGTDAWMGENVTPLKIRKDLASRTLNGSTAAAICEYSSNCLAANYRQTGLYLKALVEEKYPGIPFTLRPIGCLHVVSPHDVWMGNNPTLRTRVNESTRTLEVLGWCIKTPKHTTHLEGLSRLHKNLYGYWALRDPSQVEIPRSQKVRKKYVLVGTGV